MPKLLFTFLILSTYFSANAIEITGTILDSASHAPLAFVNIRLQKTGQATFTNAEGKFSIRVEDANQNILISLIGYRSDTIAVQNIQNPWVIYLAQVDNLLPEVNIDYNYAVDLLTKAGEKFNRNFDNYSYGKALIRYIAKEKKEPMELNEFEYAYKANASGVYESRFVDGRYAWKKDLAGKFLTTNFSVDLNIYPYSRKTWIFTDTVSKHFKATIASFSFIDGRKVVNIDLQYLHANELFSICIDDEDYTVYSYSNKSFHREHNFMGEAKFNQSSNFVFRRINEEVALPDHFTWNCLINYGASFLPISGIRNLHVDIYYYQFPDKRNPKFDSTDAVKGSTSFRKVQEHISQKPYDADFWNNNPIIKQSPLDSLLVQSFKHSKFEGNLFNAMPSKKRNKRK